MIQGPFVHFIYKFAGIAMLAWFIAIAVTVEARGGWGDTGAAILIVGIPAFLLAHLHVHNMLKASGRK